MPRRPNAARPRQLLALEELSSSIALVQIIHAIHMRVLEHIARQATASKATAAQDATMK
jgi:hypothetical protein